MHFPFSKGEVWVLVIGSATFYIKTVRHCKTDVGYCSVFFLLLCVSDFIDVQNVPGLSVRECVYQLC